MIDNILRDNKHAVGQITALVQHVMENCNLQVLSEAARRNAIRAARFARDKSNHTMHLILHAAVGCNFLQSATGAALMASADRAGRAMLQDAQTLHDDDERMSDTRPHSWWLLRHLFRAAPGSIRRWPKKLQALDTKAGGMLPVERS